MRTQVDGRRLVKELGKMTLYLREKGDPGGESSGWHGMGGNDCLLQTQVSAK